MKVYVLGIFSLLFTACSKKEIKEAHYTGNDSSSVTGKTAAQQNAAVPDRAVSVQETADSTGHSETFRTIDGNKIIRTISGDMIPLTVEDEFSDPDQQLIVKIKNFTGSKISVRIVPSIPEMNIRINQLRLPDGQWDGPFGREFSYEIKDSGEIWLVVGKSNMASGRSLGKFKLFLR